MSSAGTCITLGEMRNARNVSVRIPEAKIQLRRLDPRIILKSTLKEHDLRI
jgi:hypothetical protein